MRVWIKKKKSGYGNWGSTQHKKVCEDMKREIDIKSKGNKK